MPLGDVAIGLDQNLVVFVEEEVEVDGQVAWNQILVPRQELLKAPCQLPAPNLTSRGALTNSERGERIGRNLK